MKWNTKGVQVLRHLGLMLMIPAPKSDEINKLNQDTEYTIEIKQKKKRRSLDANAYCWVLCQKIAVALSTKGAAITKNEVYRNAIKDVGAFTYIPTRNDAVERFCEIWHGHGIGWVAEVEGECRTLPGYTNIKAYHGSSVYTTKEMTRLIDWLIEEATGLGVETQPQEYIDSMLRSWNEQEKAER